MQYIVTQQWLLAYDSLDNSFAAPPLDMITAKALAQLDATPTYRQKTLKCCGYNQLLMNRP